MYVARWDIWSTQPMALADVRIHPLYALAIPFLVFGLAFGSMLHGVQHGFEYERSGPAVEALSGLAHEGAGLSSPRTSSTVDEAVCILCQVAEAQIVLAPAARHVYDPGCEGTGIRRSAACPAPLASARGRAPPRQV